MEKPADLKKGDKVAIISTARKISEVEMLPATELLESWELKVVLGDNLYKEDNQFSGTTKERLNDLQKALDDSTVKAIFCARGGYGTVQLIGRIDFTNFLKTPKWIVGYSDVTVLHNHINTNFNIQVLHATMPINFHSNTNEALESLKNALFGEELNYEFNSHQLNRKGETVGILIGGNLSIIYSLTGTNSQIDTKGKVLFLEDLDEYLYHIDRMMMNLKRAGILENLAGLIVGGMSKMNDNSVPYGKSAIEIISDVVSDYDFPVCFDFPAGHIDDNKTLIMGAEIKLTVGDTCTLSFINS